MQPASRHGGRAPGHCAVQILKVQKVRLFGVDYNSLGMARELWLVAGERSLLGKTVRGARIERAISLESRAAWRECCCGSVAGFAGGVGGTVFDRPAPPGGLSRAQRGP